MNMITYINTISISSLCHSKNKRVSDNNISRESGALIIHSPVVLRPESKLEPGGKLLLYKVDVKCISPNVTRLFSHIHFVEYL